ncbi:MAG: hypothetical protein KF901_27735 [Myxococcales bacterium]|nr:hypothetical protein [Myxococcales bacterium]
MIFASLATAGGAQAPALDLRAAGDDPLELERLVRRLDEGALLAQLEEGLPATQRLAAIRAAPWTRHPEELLTPLCVLAGGDDALLAPAAASAAHRIAAALDADVLLAREASLDVLPAAERACARVAADETVRADLGHLVALTVAQLVDLRAE